MTTLAAVAEPPPRTQALRGLAAPAALALILLVAYYRRVADFGLYGDDHAFFGSAINRDWAGEWEWLKICLTTWPQGRPLGAGVNEGLLPHAVFALGGLAGLHLVGFGVLALNAALLHRLLARAAAPAAAFCGAAVFALSPAATVQLSLGYAYLYGLAITMGLVAAHAALDGRPVRFALCVAAAFTMVEPAVMFALLAPIVLSVHDRERWRPRLVRHVATWLGVVLALLVARKLIGDPWGGERVGEMVANPLATALRGLETVAIGSWTYASLLVERLVLPLRVLDRKLAGTLAICGGIAAAALLHLDRSPRGDRRRTSAAVLVLGGAAMVCAIYVLYFRPPWYPGSARRGFVSGVHVMPALGVAFVVAGLVQALAGAVPARLRAAPLAAAAAAIALLGAFGHVVQRDYALSWQVQKEFWQAYRRLCRDATEGTYVLILDRNVPHPESIDVFSWGTEILPGQLWSYRGAPTSIQSIASVASEPGHPSRRGPHAVIRRPPVVLFTGPDPAATIAFQGGALRWKPSYYFMLPKGEDEQPVDGNVIVLERTAERAWRRLEGTIPVDGGTLRLRPQEGDLLDRLEPARLARVLGVERAVDGPLDAR